MPSVSAGSTRWEFIYQPQVAASWVPRAGSQPVYFVRQPQAGLLVTQEQHYYPFGLPLSGVAVNTRPQPLPSQDQYNGGSALQDELLGSEAGLYSTCYRSYDPSTGRFQGVDPLASKYADGSPYAFALNDPLNFNDPEGDESLVIINGRVANPRDIATGQHVFEGSSLYSLTYQAVLNGYSSPGAYSEKTIWKDAVLDGLAKIMTGSRNAFYSDGQMKFWGYSGSVENPHRYTWTNSISVNWLYADNIPGYNTDVWLANESSNTIYFKPENSNTQPYLTSGAYPLPAGASTQIPVDGFAAPAIMPDNVFKIVTGLKARVRDEEILLVRPPGISAGTLRQNIC